MTEKQKKKRRLAFQFIDDEAEEETENEVDELFRQYHSDEETQDSFQQHQPSLDYCSRSKTFDEEVQDINQTDIQELVQQQNNKTSLDPVLKSNLTQKLSREEQIIQCLNNRDIGSLSYRMTQIRMHKHEKKEYFQCFDSILLDNPKTILFVCGHTNYNKTLVINRVLKAFYHKFRWQFFEIEDKSPNMFKGYNCEFFVTVNNLELFQKYDELFLKQLQTYSDNNVNIVVGQEGFDLPFCTRVVIVSTDHTRETVEKILKESDIPSMVGYIEITSSDSKTGIVPFEVRELELNLTLKLACCCNVDTEETVKELLQLIMNFKTVKNPLYREHDWFSKVAVEYVHNKMRQKKH